MKIFFLYLMAILYMAAGINHFIHPAFYQKIMPGWVPAANTMIVISGVAEIVLGFLLFFPVSRRWAAWGIIVLLIAVFPANIEMMKIYHRENNPLSWLTVLRLPLQLVLIAWAYTYTKKRKFSPMIKRVN